MPSQIHPSAVIDATAQLGEGVTVGPFAVIGPDVVIGDNTQIAAHVVVEANTIIGSHCQIAPGAVIGGAPQDLGYKGEPTRVRVGDYTQIREYVTLNRATGEGKETVVGNHCFLMAYSHLAHNCQVGDHVILANAAQVGGYVTLYDYVFIGGSSLIHQNCRVGRMAFLGGDSSTRQDLPPFSMNDGRASRIQGINTIGLRRRGLNPQERQNLKKAFFYLFFSGLNYSQGIEAIHANLAVDAYVEELIAFVTSSKRGIAKKTGRPFEQKAPVEPDDAELDAISR